MRRGSCAAATAEPEGPASRWLGSVISTWIVPAPPAPVDEGPGRDAAWARIFVVWPSQVD